MRSLLLNIAAVSAVAGYQGEQGLSQVHAMNIVSPFKTLSCRATIGDKVDAVRKGQTLNFVWNTRGSSRILPLLKIIASQQNTSSTQLEGYSFVDLEIALPVSRCNFDTQQVGAFNCNVSEPIVVTLKGQTGAYDGDESEPVDPPYKGTISSTKLSTEFFSDRSGNMVKFKLTTVANGKFLTMETEPFFTQNTSTSGYNHPPECTADYQPVFK